MAPENWPRSNTSNVTWLRPPSLLQPSTVRVRRARISSYPCQRLPAPHFRQHWPPCVSRYFSAAWLGEPCCQSLDQSCLRTRMKRGTLLVFCFAFVGVWPPHSARGQTSAAPPVSLAPPKAALPRAGAKNTSAASDRVSSSPPSSGASALPGPAADYDGFSVGTVEDSDTPDQAMRSKRSRAVKGSKPNPDANGMAAQPSLDQEDEALKRKLTICQNCK